MNDPELPRQDQLLKSIVDSASDAIVSKRLDGVILSWNPGAERLFGYRAEEAIGQRIHMLIPADRLHEEEAILQQVGRGERVQALETIRLHRDGSPLPVSVTVSPVFDSQGRVVGASKIARSIAHLHTARRREEQFAQIVAAASDGIIVVDATGRVEYANPATLRLLGWTAEALLGQPLEVLLPADAKAQHSLWMQRFDGAGALPRHMGQPGRFVRAMHHDGSVVPVEITISQFGDPAQPRRMALLRDCRLQQEAKQLEEAALQAAAASQTKSAFIARMSHELRTPLTVVLGFTELLQADPATATERARALVTHIRSAGLHLLTLIDDLLDTARIERGLLHLKPQPVPLRPLLEELQTQLNLVASTTRQAVELDIVAPAPMVRADPVRLRQVVYNLLTNALKYSRPGARVVVRVVHCAPHWRIDVIDSGQGIAPDRLKQLFKPFERLGQERSSISGVGLGLATARELVEAMSGQILVQSTLGQGSTFSVQLHDAAGDAMPDDAPGGDAARRAPAAPLPLPAATPSAAGRAPASPSAAGKRLLCVDDNPVNRLLIDAALGEMPGLSLEFAVDGHTAREAVLARRPDLILLDLMLPDTDGLSLIRAWRADPRLADLLVALFTADNDPHTMDMARALGVQELIAKPFDIMTLQQQILRLLA